jgi:hypothetical protein
MVVPNAAARATRKHHRTEEGGGAHTANTENVTGRTLDWPAAHLVLAAVRNLHVHIHAVVASAGAGAGTGAGGPKSRTVHRRRRTPAERLPLPLPLSLALPLALGRRRGDWGLGWLEWGGAAPAGLAPGAEPSPGQLISGDAACSTATVITAQATQQGGTVHTNMRARARVTRVHTRLAVKDNSQLAKKKQTGVDWPPPLASPKNNEKRKKEKDKNTQKTHTYKIPYPNRNPQTNSKKRSSITIRTQHDWRPAHCWRPRRCVGVHH